MTASEARHTRDLAQQLAEAQATIQALLSGQIDAVVDARSGAPVLLANAQAALRESEARYRYIAETTNEGVWLIDAEHKTTFMNRRMAQMLGCEADGGPPAKRSDLRAAILLALGAPSTARIGSHS